MEGGTGFFLLAGRFEKRHGSMGLILPGDGEIFPRKMLRG